MSPDVGGVRQDALEAGPWGPREARWADLELTANWRPFLDDPAAFLRYLTSGAVRPRRAVAVLALPHGDGDRCVR